MSGNKTMMVRLIDVALIILLGFIAISRLKTEYIELPAAGDAKPTYEKTATGMINIYSGHFDYVLDGSRKRARNLVELESVLQSSQNQLQRRKTKLVVTLKPHRSSVMQNMVDVLDICQRNQIEKSFDYDSIN